MVVPYKHIGELPALDAATLSEMMQLTQRMQVALMRIYSPNGFNIGINQGRAAGAGVAVTSISTWCRDGLAIQISCR